MQASLAPTQAAFEVVFPRAELLNLLDDTLSRDVQQPHDDESLSARFEALARYALLSGADAVLFTCSAFGGQIERVQRLDTLRSVPVLKPNEALQRQIIASGGTVAIVSMFKPTLVSILRELRELWEGTEGAPPFAPIEVHVPGALDALNRGERHKCAESIAAAVVNVLGGTSRSAVRSSTGKMRARDSPRGLPGDRKVAVLGGSFDPITDGHLKCACEIVHARAADEVWIVPCGARPDKPSLRTPYMHRLIMCHLAVDTSFGSHFPIRVCDIEMGEPHALSTYMLLQRLNADHPGTKFMFVLGADLLESMKTWAAPGVENAGEKLYREGNFLLLARPGYDIPLDLPANFKLLTPQAGTRIVTEDVSSSEIRKRIAANFGETERAEMQQGNFAMVDGLLTPAVLAHIIRYDIYGL